MGLDIVRKRKSEYLVEVSSECAVPLPFGSLRVRRAGNGGALAVESLASGGNASQMLFGPPFVIRSRRAGDSIKCKGGARKSLKKLFGEWGVPAFLRGCVPVIETREGVAAVLGSFLGFRDIKADNM